MEARFLPSKSEPVPVTKEPPCMKSRTGSRDCAVALAGVKKFANKQSSEPIFCAFDTQMEPGDVAFLDPPGYCSSHFWGSVNLRFPTGGFA